MSIKYIAISPHPPILLKTIAQEHQEKLKNTSLALEKLRSDLLEKNINTIIIISEHGEKLENAFVLDMGTVENNESIYKANYKEFGDFETEYKWDVDLELSLKIKSFLESKLALQLLNNDNLNYSNSIPLSFLNKNNEFKVLSIISSNLSKEEHLKFGEYLKEILVNQDKNIAIILSGDLAHQNHKKKEGIHYPNKFDESIRHFLNDKQYEKLISIDKTILDNNINCIYNSLMILLGILKDYHWEFEEYSYEHPFNVSYLCGQIKLK